MCSGYILTKFEPHIITLLLEPFFWAHAVSGMQCSARQTQVLLYCPVILEAPSRLEQHPFTMQRMNLVGRRWRLNWRQLMANGLKGFLLGSNGPHRCIYCYTLRIITIDSNVPYSILNILASAHNLQCQISSLVLYWVQTEQMLLSLMSSKVYPDQAKWLWSFIVLSLVPNF